MRGFRYGKGRWTEDLIRHHYVRACAAILTTIARPGDTGESRIDLTFFSIDAFYLLRFVPNLPRRALRLIARNCTTQHDVFAGEFGTEWRVGVSLGSSAPLKQTRRTAVSEKRRFGEARLKKHGSREYVQVLRLMETFALDEVTHAVEDALLLGPISFDAVHHLLLCRIERRPPRLDMDNYPHLPMAQVRTTQAADYMSLLVEVCA